MPSAPSLLDQSSAPVTLPSPTLDRRQTIGIPTILVAEDDMAMASILITGIGEVAGYHVIHASNGRHAKKILTTRNIDLIVSDIIMPDLDGLELIRIRNDLTPNTPIIIMTGGCAKLPLMDLPKMARMLGAEAAFRKPVDLRRLLDLIRSMIDAPQRSWKQSSADSDGSYGS